MGLEVARDDSAGYAFIRQSEETDEVIEEWEDTETAPLPRVLRRTRPLFIRRFLWSYYAKN